MINFRCWKCHRKYAKAETKIGQTFQCACEFPVRVPKRSGGSSRVKTLIDRLIEAVLCGGGCALIGFVFSLFVLSRIRFFGGEEILVAVIPVVCGLAGVLGGERALDFIGDMARDQHK